MGMDLPSCLTCVALAELCVGWLAATAQLHLIPGLACTKAQRISHAQSACGKDEACVGYNSIFCFLLTLILVWVNSIQ